MDHKGYRPLNIRAQFLAVYGSGIVSVVSATALNSIAPILIAQNWGVEDYGLFTSFWSLIAIIGLATMAVQNTVATRSSTLANVGPRVKASRIGLDHFSLSLIVPIFAIFLLSLTFMLIKPINVLSSNWSLTILSIVLLGSTLTSIAFGRYIAKMKFRALYKINLLLATLKVSTIFFVGKLEFPINDLIIILVAEQFVMAIILFLYTQSYARIDLNFTHSSNLQPSIFTLLIWTLYYGDVFLVRLLADPTQAGLYAAASSLTKIAILPLTLIINKNYSIREHEYRHLITKSKSQNLWIFLPSISIISLIFLFKDNLIPSLFGDGFESMGEYVPFALMANLPWMFLLLLTSKILGDIQRREIYFVFISGLMYFLLVMFYLNNWRDYTFFHFLLGSILFLGLEIRSHLISREKFLYNI